jgi:hypothetical protein
VREQRAITIERLVYRLRLSLVQWTRTHSATGHPMKISTILEKIDEHQLFVPAFQREYVWTRDDAKQLLDSLIKDYPTGTMLTWETNSPPELKGAHKYDQKQGAVRILLDGQQRITTLYMLVRGTIPAYYSVAEISVDTRGLYVNVETQELEYFSKQKMQHNPCWQNITEIFQKKVRPRDILRELEKSNRQIVDREREDRIDDGVRAVERILDREFPEQTIPIKASIREAIDIFYKVNASGVALTDAELALAQISGYWPQARDIFKSKIVKLAQVGFIFKLDFIVYALLGCLYHVGSDMRKLHGADNKDRMRDAWKRLETQVLDYVINILRSSAFVDHTEEINSVYALIPIIVYCFDKTDGHLTEVEIHKMVKWFYYSQIRTRYASQLPQKLDRDLRIIGTSESPFEELLRVIEEERPLEIVPGEFEGRAVQHPLFGLMRWFFKSRNAVCLTTGVGLRQTMGEKYTLENDHIFPYSTLKKAGYGIENRVKYALAQEMTNRAILTKVANRTKSDKDVGDYLRSAQERFPKALSQQCIPEDQSLWKIDQYREFLAERRRLLARELNSFLKGISADTQSASAVSIEDLIAEGETEDLEFKSSVRWDFQQQAPNKKLEDVILKSVAAFANSQGGTLLIGVSDDGKILGLERDYAALGNSDRDKFERHLRTLIVNAFGDAFVVSKIKVEFHEIEAAQICRVDIQPSPKPLILSFPDKNGQLAEKFYVRNGNSSREMPLSEMHTYASDRFY